MTRGAVPQWDACGLYERTVGRDVTVWAIAAPGILEPSSLDVGLRSG